MDFINEQTLVKQSKAWSKQYLFQKECMYMEIYTMSCEKGSDSEHKVYVKLTCFFVKIL